MKTRWPAAAISVIALLALAGCSDNPGEGPAAGDALTGVDTSDASAAQAAEISDRNVTADQYQTAFGRYRDCLSAGGFELVDVSFDGPIYKFGIPGAAVDSGVDETCYNTEFRYVDMLWQSSDLVQNSSDTAVFIRDCLTRFGIEPADTLAEMDRQLADEGIEITQCES